MSGIWKRGVWILSWMLMAGLLFTCAVKLEVSAANNIENLQNTEAVQDAETTRGEISEKEIKTAQNALYSSTLPVIYINTNDGKAVTSKTTYKAATMSMQGNSRYNTPAVDLYSGSIEIRGRGNHTWDAGQAKKPYKIKLDKKTNLLGLGKSKHWALLANYFEESHLRNKTSYDLSGKFGLVYLPSVHVDLVFNGKYVGMYQLVGNAKIESDRVDIFDWEECADDTAKAIGKANGITGSSLDALKTQMNNNLSWITTGSVTYGGKTYKISDYTELPKDSAGNVDVNGGFLFELDEYYDETSKFKTTNGLPINFKNPEYAKTNSTMFSEAKEFVQATENCARSADYYATYKGQKVHYSDVIDVDSLVAFYLIQELYFNEDGIRKSCYLYKDLGGKLTFGPVWDMDWSSQSSNNYHDASYYNCWQIDRMTYNNNWVKSLVRDPYFVSQVFECYWKNHDAIMNVATNGGVIDQEQAYLYQAATNNYSSGFTYYKVPFTTAADRLKNFLKTRISWMNTKMQSASSLLNAYGRYTSNSKVSVTADTSQYGKTTYTATVLNSSSKGVFFYLNGKKIGSVDLVGEKASITVNDSLLTEKEGGLNTIQARCYDTNGAIRDSGNYTNYAYFKKSIKKDIKLKVNTGETILKTGDSLKLDYTLTINDTVITDEDLLKDVKVELTKTGGFEKDSLKDLQILSTTANAPTTIIAADSGVEKVRVSLDGVSSDNEAVIIVPGDVNVDGRLSVKDAALAASYVRSKRMPAGEYSLALMDMDGNGKVSVKDVTALIKILRDNA